MLTAVSYPQLLRTQACLKFSRIGWVCFNTMRSQDRPQKNPIQLAGNRSSLCAEEPP